LERTNAFTETNDTSAESPNTQFLYYLSMVVKPPSLKRFANIFFVKSHAEKPFAGHM
jgi:hypothetical protein